jgi:DNA-binding CsgD family transcriptional regulator
MLPGAASEAATVTELGSELSRQVGQVVPHDGYLLAGLDPVTGAGCFLSMEHGYSAGARRRLDIENGLGCGKRPFRGPGSVIVCGSGASDRRMRRLHNIMAADGFGSEMCIALNHGGVPWAALVLLREQGRTPFSSADVGHAEQLASPLGLAVKRFIADKPLRPSGGELPTGVVIVGQDDQIKAATASGRAMLRTLLPDRGPVGDDELFGNIWNITYTARRATTAALARVPTPQGWIAMHAQLLDQTAVGDVVVTLQPASGATLLPAVSAWYGISGREQAVIAHALKGLSAKQIARRLDLSPHTVNDHFKAIYRKTGVSSREELLASLSA